VEPIADLERRIAGIASLDQPLRRDLYRLLASTDGWTTRDEAADALGVPRSVAAFHLDKLVDAGVLDVHFERPNGRSGPGAGRPSKLYRPRFEELSASVPERRYDLAGTLLADAVAESTRTGEPVLGCLRSAARAAGRDLGEGAGRRGVEGVLDILAEQGYEPEVGEADIALANCPFHRLAERQQELVCGMNLELLGAVIDAAAPTDGLTARRDPVPGYCCVRLGTGSAVR
jgi:predicted ArsR family transcriptional regulator